MRMDVARIDVRVQGGDRLAAHIQRVGRTLTRGGLSEFVEERCGHLIRLEHEIDGTVHGVVGRIGEVCSWR